MSDKKISQLDPVTDVLDDDDYVIARSGDSKRITGASLKAAFLSAIGWSSAGDVLTVQEDGSIAAEPGGASPFLTVNSGPVEGEALYPLQVTKQPVVQPSGIPQPLPPLFGFLFAGEQLSYALSDVSDGVVQICTGSDGNIWVAGGTNAAVWRVTPAGDSTRFAIAGSSNIYGICAGPDGNLWATDEGSEHLLKIGTDGSLIATIALTGASVVNVCAGADGNLWVSDDNSRVWRVTPGGTTTPFDLPQGDFLYSPDAGGICAGPDGNVWVSDITNQVLWKVTPGGAPSSISISGAADLFWLCPGSDGNVWVVDDNANAGSGAVFRVTPEGAATNFVLPHKPNNNSICAGSGGDLWVCSQDNYLMKITTAGVVTSFALDNQANWICSGPEGALWMSAANEVFVMPFTIQAGAILITAGDLAFALNTQGPVIVDQSDGHTYRIISTAGVLSTVQVT